MEKGIGIGVGKFLILGCALFFMGCFSSYNKTFRVIEPVVVYDTIYVKSDPIIYNLPEKTIEVIEYVIRDKDIIHCKISHNNVLNQIFLFFVDSKRYKEKLDSLLVEKTNRFLNVREKYIPVLFSQDTYAETYDEGIIYLCDFNFCFVVIDYNGNAVQWILDE